VGLPIVVLIVSLAQRTWYPTGDQAQAELRMRSLLADPPLVGAAGRIQDEAGRQGNHPGPLMFWVTWPLYALLGRSAWAFEAATALVNLAWLTLSIWLVRRRTSILSTAWFGAVSLVLLGGFGLDALSQPWNPWVALLPFAVLVLATWSAIDGDRWAPVLAVGAGSYALQGHVGYLPLVLPLCGIALAAPLWRWWRERGAVRDWARPLGVSLLVAGVAWSGPIWDMVHNEPNNMAKLVANFSNPSDPPIGISSGIEAVLQSVDPFGPWVWGGSAVAGSAWPGLIFLVLWAAVAVVVLLRGGHPRLTRLNLLLAATLVIGTYAVSRIFGALYLYTFRWIVVIAAFQVFTIGWGLASLAPRPSATTRHRVIAVAIAFLVMLSGVMSVRIARQDIPYDQSSRTIAGLASPTAAALDPKTRYLIRWDDPAYLGGIGFGLILELERRGFDVGGGPQFEAALEPQRVRCPGDYDAVLTVATGNATIGRYRSRDDMTEIAEIDPREDPALWQRSFDQLLSILRTDDPALTEADLEGRYNFLLLSGDQPQQIVELASDLVLGGVPSAVFVQDPAPLEQLDQADRRNDPCFS